MINKLLIRIILILIAIPSFSGCANVKYVWQNSNPQFSNQNTLRRDYAICEEYSAQVAAGMPTKVSPSGYDINYNEFGTMNYNQYGDRGYGSFDSSGYGSVTPRKSIGDSIEELGMYFKKENRTRDSFNNCMAVKGWSKIAKQPRPVQAPAPAQAPAPLLESDKLKKAKSYVQKDQYNPEAHLNLGNVYLESKRHQEAIEAYKQAIQLNTDYVDAHINLGVAYAESKRHQEAMEAYKQALKIKPDHIVAQHNLAATYSDLGRYQEALEVLKQIIRMQPDNADAHSGLGYMYRRLSMFKECIEASKQAIRINSNHVNAHFNLGLARIALGDRDSSLDEYKILKTLDPEKANMLFDQIYK